MPRKLSGLCRRFRRIDRRYRRQILIRSTDPARLLAEMTIPSPRWIVDIDPVSTL